MNTYASMLSFAVQGKISTNAKTLSSPGTVIEHVCSHYLEQESDYPSYCLAVPVSNNEGGIIYEARIEDGRVFYENRW